MQLLITNSFVRENLKKINDDYAHLVKRQNQFQELWNESLNELSITKNELLRVEMADILKSPELIELNEKTNNLLALNSPDVELAINILMKPLYEYFKQIQVENHLNKNSKILLPQLTKLMKLHSDGELEIQKYKIKLDENISNIEASIDKLIN